jgi:hypothetical protein
MKTIMRLIVFLVAVTVSCLAAEWGVSIVVESANKAGISSYNPNHFHALIIAIDKYKNWPDLRCAGNDGRTMADVLKKQYGFSDVKLLADAEASREGILEALDSYLALGEKDSLLIYYAGHGWMDPKVKTGYWVPSEARKDKKFDYVANSRIVEDYFKKYKVKHLLVMADSCFSGTLLRGMDQTRGKAWKLPSGFKKPSRWVMTSGDLAPVADDSGAGHSPFAARVLQYLQHSDSPAFGVQDLYVYVRKNLDSEAIAQPMKTPSHMPGGEFVFCRLKTPLDAGNTRGLKMGAQRSVQIVHTEDVKRFYMSEPARLFKSAAYSEMKGRFEKREGDAVFDKQLKKTWHIGDVDQIYSRKKAIEACRNMGDTCRLPTVAELSSLITQRKRKGDWGQINGAFFPKHSRTSRYWSSTKERMKGCQYVDFSSGTPAAGSDADHMGIIAISD